MADKNRITVTVNAGEHNREGCPVSVDVEISRSTRRWIRHPYQASGAAIPADLNSDGKTATFHGFWMDSKPIRNGHISSHQERDGVALSEHGTRDNTAGRSQPSATAMDSALTSSPS